MDSIGKYPSPTYSRKQEIRKENITNNELYKELLYKYESLAEKCQELKNVL